MWSTVPQSEAPLSALVMGNPPRPRHARKTSASLLRADRLASRVWQSLTGYLISLPRKVSCLPEPVQQLYETTERAAVHALSAGPVDRPAFYNPYKIKC